MGQLPSSASLLQEALCHFGPSTPFPLVRNMMTMYCRIAGYVSIDDDEDVKIRMPGRDFFCGRLDGCSQAYSAVASTLNSVSQSCGTASAATEGESSSTGPSSMEAFCSKNIKLTDPILSEVLEYLNSTLWRIGELEMNEMAVCVGLIAVPFITSGQQLSSDGNEATSTIVAKGVKKKSDVNKSLSVVPLFELAPEKMQKRMLSLASKLLKMLCEGCVGLCRVFREVVASTRSDGGVLASPYKEMEEGSDGDGDGESSYSGEGDGGDREGRRGATQRISSAQRRKRARGA
jgi:hypothetical protein